MLASSALTVIKQLILPCRPHAHPKDQTKLLVQHLACGCPTVCTASSSLRVSSMRVLACLIAIISNPALNSAQHATETQNDRVQKSRMPGCLVSGSTSFNGMIYFTHFSGVVANDTSFQNISSGHHLYWNSQATRVRVDSHVEIGDTSAKK